MRPARRYINGVKNTIPGVEAQGQSIWIQAGQRLLLDCDIDVYMLIVQGTLEFDRKDINRTANYIFIMHGTFAVGSELERRLASRRQRRWWRRWAALPFCASAVPRRAPPATMLSHRGIMAAPGQEWDAERRPPPNRPAIPVIMPLPRGPKSEI